MTKLLGQWLCLTSALLQHYFCANINYLHTYAAGIVNKFLIRHLLIFFSKLLFNNMYFSKDLHMSRCPPLLYVPDQRIKNSDVPLHNLGDGHGHDHVHLHGQSHCQCSEVGELLIDTSLHKDR